MAMIKRPPLAMIERMYPAGTVTFGGILDFMMRQGGIAEFFACVAACGGVAGIMSTADSSALAITNIVTKEIIVNGDVHEEVEWGRCELWCFEA